MFSIKSIPNTSIQKMEGQIMEGQFYDGSFCYKYKYKYFISHFLLHDSKKKDIYMAGYIKVINVCNDLTKPYG